jgi:chitodextrinase
MYVLGGWNGTTYFADIQYATLNANGTVGPFSASVTNLTAAKRGHTSVVNNGIVYTLGGNDGSAVTLFTELSRIGSPPSSNSAGYVARYERTFDIGSSSHTITGFTVAGTTPCSTYSVSYKSAGSSGVYGALTTLSSVPQNVLQTLSLPTTRYLFLSITLNDTSCGAQSSITSIGVSYNVVPSIPTLLAPAANATRVSVLPEFRLGTTDADSDNVQYRIYIRAIDPVFGFCTILVKTIDQTLTQTGWTSQSVQSGTAYPSTPSTITQFAVHQTQPPAVLSANTLYCWAAQAIDPWGTNTWSLLSATQYFTTDVAAKSNVNIGGGTTIYGGTNFSTGP